MRVKDIVEIVVGLISLSLIFLAGVMARHELCPLFAYWVVFVMGAVLFLVRRWLVDMFFVRKNEGINQKSISSDSISARKNELVDNFDGVTEDIEEDELSKPLQGEENGPMKSIPLSERSVANGITGIIACGARNEEEARRIEELFNEDHEKMMKDAAALRSDAEKIFSRECFDSELKSSKE